MSDRATRIESALAARMERGGGIPTAPPGPAPLTAVQRSLWILSQLAQGETANPRPLHLRIEGPLKVDALNRALSRIVDRHSILRSTFPIVDGEPMQVVGEPPNFDLAMNDLTDFADPAGAAAERCRVHGETAFDLTVGAPFAPILFKLADDDYVLSIAMHHIVFDGWSEPRLLDELAIIYDAQLGSEPDGLARLNIQVRDFAAWQTDRIDDLQESSDLEWWIKQLSDLPPDTELPTDRPPLDDGPAPEIELDLGADLTQRLSEVATRHDATSFMLLLAALQTLTMRLTGQTDVVIGVPSAGRTHPDTEPLIGCFIDTMALRSYVDPDLPFDDLLRGTRTDVLEALAHTAAPFSRVLGEVRPWTGDSRLPLYRVHLQLRNFPGILHTSEHVQISSFGQDPEIGAHLAVRGEMRGDSLRLTFRYDLTLFRADTVSRWAEAYRRILQAAVTSSALPIGDLPIVSPEEVALVSGGWDGLAASSEPPVLAADLLRRAARETPGASAIEDGQDARTYADFDAFVDQIASGLEQRGLGQDSPVVLFLGRGIPMAAAMFGALRAGVPYVPVDSELTSEWLTSVVDQVRPGLVLVEDRSTADLAAGAPSILTVAELAAEGVEPPTRRPAPDDLAYILYTSGSTGVPKGAMIDQANLGAFLAPDSDVVRPGQGNRVVWVASPSFDAIATVVHTPLSTGATVVVRDPAAMTSIRRFFAFCEAKSITHLSFPTSFGHVFMEEAVAHDLPLPPTLQRVSMGGEQMRADIVEAWFHQYGEAVAVRNTYGPTETTVWLVGDDVQSDDMPFTHMPIGRPVRGAKIRVVDARGGLAPIAVTGELVLGGPHVGRGYIGEQALTDNSFSRDEHGTAWYRSGDLARWLPDGRLEVLGRIDRQFKVRGYRAEPGEVESVLRGGPGVRDAFAHVTKGFDGEAVLYAYVEGHEIDMDTLESIVETSLPAFLRPAEIIAVTELPRLVSGKIDVRSLPQPGSQVGEPVDSDVAHVTEALRSVWMEVLDLDAVGDDDGFFALGGHSLLAIRVISRIRDRLGVELPLPSLFTHPKLSELAAVTADLASPTGGTTSDTTTAEADVDLDELISGLSDDDAMALLATLEEEQS